MADPLKVECPHCGGSLKLKDRSAEGKKVRCPKCQEPFKVELPPEEDPVDDLDNLDNLDDMEAADDEDLDDGEDRPKKSKGSSSKGSSSKKTSKKKKSKSRGSSMLPLIIGGAVLGGIAVVGLLVVVVMAFSGPRNKINMAYLLPEHDGIARIKVAEMLKAPLLADFVNSQMYKQMSGGQDGNFSDVDTVTFGFKIPAANQQAAQMANAGGMRDVVCVLRTKKRVDFGPDVAKGKAKEATHNGRKYYTGIAPMSPSMFTPDTYTIVVAGEADLKRVMDQGGTAQRRPEFDFIDPEHHVIIAVVPSSPDAFKMPQELMEATQGGTGPGAGMAQQLQKSFSETAQGVAFAIDIREGLEIGGKLSCKDEAGAGGLKGQLDLLLGEGKSQFEQQVKSNPLAAIPTVKELVDLAQQTLASINLSQNKNVLDLKITVPNTLKALVTKGQSDPMFKPIMESVISGLGLPGNSMGSGQPNFGAGPPGMHGAMPPGMHGAMPPGAPMHGAFPPGAPGAAPMHQAFPPGAPGAPGANPMHAAFPPGTPMPMPAP
jgi:predicted Zn finger-like uncharacterized protein